MVPVWRKLRKLGSRKVADSVFSCPEVTSGDQGFPVWLHQWDLLHPPFPTPGSPQNAPADSPALRPWVRPAACPPHHFSEEWFQQLLSDTGTSQLLSQLPLCWILQEKHGPYPALI